MAAGYKQQLRKAAKARKGKQRDARRDVELRRRADLRAAAELMTYWVERGTELARRPLPANLPSRRPPQAKEGRWVARHHLRVGDLLIALDGASAVIREVPADQVRPITLQPVAEPPQKPLPPIRATRKHPWYVKDRGWVATEDLRPGDLLRTSEGKWLPVSKVEDKGEVEPVFNLQVQGAHTCCVGVPGTKQAALVHNASTQGVDPQQVDQAKADANSMRDAYWSARNRAEKDAANQLLLEKYNHPGKHNLSDEDLSAIRRTLIQEGLLEEGTGETNASGWARAAALGPGGGLTPFQKDALALDQVFQGMIEGAGEQVLGVGIAVFIIGGSAVCAPFAITATGIMIALKADQAVAAASLRAADGQSTFEIVAGTVCDMTGVTSLNASLNNTDLATGKQLMLSYKERGKLFVSGAADLADTAAAGYGGFKARMAGKSRADVPVGMRAMADADGAAKPPGLPDSVKMTGRPDASPPRDPNAGDGAIAAAASGTPPRNGTPKSEADLVGAGVGANDSQNPAQPLTASAEQGADKDGNGVRGTSSGLPPSDANPPPPVHKSGNGNGPGNSPSSTNANSGKPDFYVSRKAAVSTERQVTLGTENGVYKPHEGFAGVRLEEKLGRQVARHEDHAYDFTDKPASEGGLGKISLKGPMMDREGQVLPPKEIQRQLNQLVTKITRDSHPSYGADTVVVDLYGLTSNQKAYVKSLVAQNAPANHSRIFYID